MINLSDRNYQSYYTYAAKKSMESFWKDLDVSFQVTETAAKEITEMLAKRLKAASRQTVDALYIDELRKEEAYQAYLDQDPTHKELFESIDSDLIEILKRDGADFLERAVPGQGKIFRETIDMYQAMILEVFQRIDEAKHELEQLLFSGKQFHVINLFHADAGDSHNQGRTTVILGTDAGKCVYKPHDLSIDRFMQSFFKRYFSDISRIPEAIVRDGYGFCEFIENIPITNHDGAEPYFEKLGGLCAVFRMLHSRDIHVENLLCDGTFPVLIDLETIVSPISKSLHRSTNSLYPELDRTLYFSCLFPTLNGGYDISPLFDRTELNKSTPVIEGRKIVVTDYMDSFLHGYGTVYQRILDRKEELGEALQDIADCKLRTVLRKTRAYAELINSTRHPARIAQKERDQEVEELLASWFVKAGDPSAHRIATKETQAIARGDVPYFYTKGDSRDLFSEGDLIAEEFFLQSALKNADESLNSMTEKSLSFEQDMFRLAAKRCLKPKYDLKGRPLKEKGIEDQKTEDVATFSEMLSRKTCIQKAEEIFRHILEESIISPEGDLLFFTTDLENNSAMEVMQGGLADGFMGVALFAAALLTVSEDEALRRDAFRLIKALLIKQAEHIYMLDSLKPLYVTDCSVGFYSGLAGWLFALDKILLLLKEAGKRDDVSVGNLGFLEKQAQENLKRALKLIDQLPLETFDADPANGLAGLLHVLCLLSEEGNDEISKQQIRKIADLVLSKKEKSDKEQGYWKMRGEHKYLSGMAHGQCGYGAALRKAGQLLQEESYLKEAQRAYEFEDKIYSEELKGWPDLRKKSRAARPMHGYCSGGPGIGLDMLQMQGELAERNLNRAIDQTLSCPLMLRDHLCCGNTARAEFLIEAAKTLKRADLMERAGQLLQQIALRAEKNQGYLTFDTLEDNRGRYMPSLYFGSTGIGYELLRYADPDRIPCPLLK